MSSPACRSGSPTRCSAGSVSNGMAFLLTVIPISSSRCSASLPVTPSGVTSTSRRWLSVPPETTRAPSPASVSAMTRAFSIVRRWSVAEGLLRGQLEGDGLAGDDMHQRAALRAREDVPVDRGGQGSVGVAVLDGRERGRVEPGSQRAPAEGHPAARSAQRLVGRRRDEVRVRERARMDVRRDEARRCGPCR